MILSAGLGTRLKPWTNEHPKALALVNGRTLLERNIKYLQQYGIFDVLINVHHFADQIIDRVKTEKGWGSHIEISHEKEYVLETGGGIQFASWYFKDANDFVVMNVDILTNMDLGKMIEKHRERKATVTLAVSRRKSSRYLLFNQQERLLGWENIKTGEKKIPYGIDSSELNPLAFSGIHVMNNTFLKYLNKQGKYSIIDTYLDICQQTFIGYYDHTSDLLIDVGTSQRLIQAETLFL